MDGFGIASPIAESNAIYAQPARPTLTRSRRSIAVPTIGASGLDVGLPDGQMGNSEVGHTNIGAGRVVYQMLVKITKDIEDGRVLREPGPAQGAWTPARARAPHCT